MATTLIQQTVIARNAIVAVSNALAQLSIIVQNVIQEWSYWMGNALQRILCRVVQLIIMFIIYLEVSSIVLSNVQLELMLMLLPEFVLNVMKRLL